MGPRRLVLIGGVSGATLARYYTDPTVARDDYRGVTHFIDATAQPTDAILLTALASASVFGYYYTGGLPVYALRGSGHSIPQTRLRNWRSSWAIRRSMPCTGPRAKQTPGGLHPGLAEQPGLQDADQWHGNMRLAVYVMPEQRPPDETVDELNLPLGADITLLGYRGWNLAPSAGEVTQLQLLWQAEATPAALQGLPATAGTSVTRSLHSATPNLQARAGPRTPGRLGETVADNHGLLIPPGIASGHVPPQTLACTMSRRWSG